MSLVVAKCIPKMSHDTSSKYKMSYKSEIWVDRIKIKRDRIIHSFISFHFIHAGDNETGSQRLD